MESSQSIAFVFLRFWNSLNFKKDNEFVGITVLFLDEKLKARLQSDKFKWNDIPSTETELISPFQAEQQMEANFSGSSSTSRQIKR
ncbi:hypothetical protein HID58_045548 [Brassica napus]|uniref:Uncharacterized protein n=1 Tax=Brassica napus TaxID=3708 RepID=A0ABQ8ATU7_BRANA|nr:hypothetical protein HID58_045548 [Brassica napus]